MTAVVLSVDYLRDRAVDFSVPLYVDQQAVGYKRPVFEADMLGFVKPYSYEVKKQIFFGGQLDNLYFAQSGILMDQCLCSVTFIDDSVLSAAVVFAVGNCGAGVRLHFHDPAVPDQVGIWRWALYNAKPFMVVLLKHTR